MQDELRYGTEVNPIRLLKDNSKRLLITRCTRLAPGKEEEQEYVDLGKIRGQTETDPFLIYMMNLISNPNLSEKAVRLGAWLYWDFEIDGEAKIYDITDGSPKPSLKHLGDEIFICVGNPVTGNYEYFDKKFPNLLDKLARVNIRLSRDESIEALTQLHEFYYITATDICRENSFLETTETNESLKKIDSSTQLVHINVTTAMKNKSVAGKWLPFKPI